VWLFDLVIFKTGGRVHVLPLPTKESKGTKKTNGTHEINCCQTKLSWNETINSINELYFSTCISQLNFLMIVIAHLINHHCYDD